MRQEYLLPRALLNARNAALVCKFTETNTAQVEITHVALRAATAETAIDLPGTELRFLLTSCDDAFLCHSVNKYKKHRNVPGRIVVVLMRISRYGRTSTCPIATLSV